MPAANIKEERDKVLTLALKMAEGHSLHTPDLLRLGLTEADLDEYWQFCERIVDKARTKPEVEPTRQDLLNEVRSWVDYYYPPTALDQTT